MNIKTRQTLASMTLSCLLTVLSPVPVLAQNPSALYAQIVPPSWTPSLEQVAESIEESAGTDLHASQQALNRIGQNLADLRDAQLFIVYMRLMQHLNAVMQVNLYQEQDRWLNQRKEKAQASVVSQGGTLASLEYSDTFRKITEERLKELQARLKKHVTVKSSQPIRGEQP